MRNKASIDVLVLGAGPGGLSIAAALSKEGLRVEVLSANDHREPWPYTYGIWGEEVDELGLNHLLEHRWQNTVSFFGQGDMDPAASANQPINHERDYGLFDKKKLQSYWIKECDSRSVKWHKDKALDLEINESISTVFTSRGNKIKARLIIDASGYDPIFLKSKKENNIAIQTCYGVVGRFNSSPIEKGQFILMDYRCDHLSSKEKSEPPTFLYAMDLGNGRFFLEETSLGLSPPLTMEKLKTRLHQRLEHKGLKIISLENEEHGIYLPMNLPLPDTKQSILGFGGSAAMVHPASGYLIGALLRRAPYLAKTISLTMKDEHASPSKIALKGWEVLWPSELKRKQALYKFGLEKLMRFNESQLRLFFEGFFELPNNQWYGFLTNTLTIEDLVKAMWRMFLKAPWSVRWGLMGMQGRELRLLWEFLKPQN